MKQAVSGVLNLGDVREISPDLKVKIAVARDCRVIQSQVVPLKTDQRAVKFDLTFEHEHSEAVGVRLLAGPDVPDEQLRSMEHQERWLPATAFTKGVARKIDLEISDRLYQSWWRRCRTYTLRGRVVCRRWLWNPIEQTFVACDAPVRGARVTALDVDCFWWWCRRDEVGSDFTDLNGNFEINFTWCCWWWRPWLFRTWELDPSLVDRIRGLLQQVPLDVAPPKPDPIPDFGIFQKLTTGIDLVGPNPPAPDEESASGNFNALGEQLVRRLPAAPDLESLRVWPWWRRLDCKPDIVFRVEQDCGNGLEVVYDETLSQTRWNVDTEVDGITLIADDNACCGPFCCSDPPDGDCLVIQGVGCGGYPITEIEQDLVDPLVGYAHPGTQDRPFGGTIRLLGVFGDASGVDYYKLQRRRISPVPTGWQDLPEGEVGAFLRGHWLGVAPWWQFETVKLLDVAGEKVLRTVNRYREENPAVVSTVDPSNADRLTDWVTASGSLTGGAPMAGLTDGVYEVRVVGYHYDQASDQLVDQKIMALCPPTGEPVDPAQHATLRLRLDNRVVLSLAGSVHLNTTEPDCDFPAICAVVKNEDPSLPLNLQLDRCVDPCGFARVSAGDTLTIHFQATDSDGHLEGYSLTAHWAESDVFNVLGVGSLAADPDPLYGPRYAQTFLGGQGLYRAGLPPASAEHDRPFWYGGHFKVTVGVGDLVPSSPHKAFETCCAYLLRLRIWKRTTNGCSGSEYFHNNHCEFSFTVIREDLVGDPGHPSCSELCPPRPQPPVETGPPANVGPSRSSGPA